MNRTEIDGRSVNTLWASVLVVTLWRCGVRQAVVSPGSRSTPLTLALARHPGIEAIAVLDERSAAFFALGLARRSFAPVVLVCTSGTAGANYFPAVIEAQESGVPLIILTADRPPEMRACASGQTIDQQKLFGANVNFHHELAVPEASLAMLAYLRQTLAHACQSARQPQFGPVHLNVPFRDPLAPMLDEAVAPVASAIGEEFFTHLAPAQLVDLVPVKIWPRGASPRGVIVAGPASPENVTYYVTNVSVLARALGWPILADGISPLRHDAAKDALVITAYDAILRNPAIANELRPQQVLCLGDWPTSKVLRAWIASSGAEIVQVSQRSDNRDALHGRTRHLCAPVEALVTPKRKARATGYAAVWRKAEQAARAALTSVPRLRGGIFEGDVVSTLADVLPKKTTVFVASSMPVRDVEYFWPATMKGHRFYFNRGANGIDGTLSTALGVAHGGVPTVLLTGDLAFLHDSNGLLLSAKLRGALTVVLINNQGGGIFEHLPVAGIGSAFEEFFATPQEVDFAKLCAAHGVEHRLIRSLAELKRAVGAAPRQGVRVLEVRTDRKRDAAMRKRLFAAAAEATK
ncbi:MAG: 2-succinyl-5-enolpyruvyl-6-hydroxy-3-cyclohexene-1-carboxylic-acid synthase [Opitutaceae bacterium]|nr:2-succinyl-5-enolpyruvyl-6-hydroxy-3-cyclohexene-1-carboxylic-acid synthase [Opitutaceae bacterium]